jgi:hypothetical protein
MKNKFKGYITTNDAAALAQVGSRTIRRWCSLGYVEAFKVYDNWVVLRSSLVKFLKRKGIEL